MPTAHIIVKGKVQGVFYRASAKDVAQEMGVGGWIRNRPDGAVELVASGPAGSLEKFVDWCRKGPAGAEVTALEIENLPQEDHAAFVIRKA